MARVTRDTNQISISIARLTCSDVLRGCKPYRVNKACNVVEFKTPVDHRRGNDTLSYHKNEARWPPSSIHGSTRLIYADIADSYLTSGKTRSHLTNKLKFNNLALNKDLVLRTWSGLLMNEDQLPDDWTYTEGVLHNVMEAGVPHYDILNLIIPNTPKEEKKNRTAFFPYELTVDCLCCIIFLGSAQSLLGGMGLARTSVSWDAMRRRPIDPTGNSPVQPTIPVFFSSAHACLPAQMFHDARAMDIHDQLQGHHLANGAMQTGMVRGGHPRQASCRARNVGVFQHYKQHIEKEGDKIYYTPTRNQTGVPASRFCELYNSKRRRGPSAIGS
ncbi:hypothetical protein DFH06DRAFT_1132594 [Mycena polygramma]|nr:hypothetical protein DFH06DRAFT_1132594 [Mycena polygramma]